MKVPSRPNDKCYVRLVDDIPDDHTGDTYDQVFITDDEEIYQWASEDRYRLRMIKFLQKYKCIRYILDCSHDVNAVWKSVVWADEIINEEEPIFVTDTLILHCGSIESYRKVIPRIRGSYNRLVLHGHMSWFQVKQLIHPNVKQVRINATFEMLPVEIERENFVNYIMKHCRGAEYK
uniref:Metallophos domain-containing protein n=1 Tax=Panagrellus redivivus TaxID=6233 RepID=A0A7E4V6Q8_PANRE